MLYVGGEFHDGGGFASADYLVACDLTTGQARPTVTTAAISGPVYALTADSNGVLYAGGGFTNLENLPAADNVAYLAGGTWHAMGSGSPLCDCAVSTFVRSLTAIGTDIYVGTDSTNVAGIAQADNVARGTARTGARWAPTPAGTDGWFPPATSIDAADELRLEALRRRQLPERRRQSRGRLHRGLRRQRLEHRRIQRVGRRAAPRGGRRADGLRSARSRARSAKPLRGWQLHERRRRRASQPHRLQPTPTPTTTPASPNISALRLSRTTFRAAPSGGPFRAARVAIGTIVSFTLDKPGSVRFTIDRAASGRKVKSRCVKPSAKNRGKPRCDRWLAVKGSFTVTGRKGVNKIELRGRIGGKTLKPGRYRLNAKGIGPAASSSPTKRTAFKIVR